MFDVSAGTLLPQRAERHGTTIQDKKHFRIFLEFRSIFKFRAVDNDNLLDDLDTMCQLSSCSITAD